MGADLLEEDLGQIQGEAQKILELYDVRQQLEKYVDGELPRLPFIDGAFDLAVCSHLLFLYSEQLDERFHLASIRELCRIATEVRIFPLLELGARTSRHLRAVTAGLIAGGYMVDIVPVAYEFQRGGNQVMKVRGAEQDGVGDTLQGA